jgi:hypothetical protein
MELAPSCGRRSDSFGEQFLAVDRPPPFPTESGVYGARESHLRLGRTTIVQCLWMSLRSCRPSSIVSRLQRRATDAPWATHQ